MYNHQFFFFELNIWATIATPYQKKKLFKSNEGVHYKAVAIVAVVDKNSICVIVFLHKYDNHQIFVFFLELKIWATTATPYQKNTSIQVK